ncbi:TPA: hypothetical protein ACH3X3_000231 [Trebouxia sp. C0006]
MTSYDLQQFRWQASHTTQHDPCSHTTSYSNIQPIAQNQRTCELVLPYGGPISKASHCVQQPVQVSADTDVCCISAMVPQIPAESHDQTNGLLGVCHPQHNNRLLMHASSATRAQVKSCDASSCTIHSRYH